MLTTVAALSRNRVIGVDGQLPWKLPGDLRHFRDTTRGGTVIMGRATFDSIGKPLPQRENWVLTRQAQWSHPGVRVFRGLGELLSAAQNLERGWVIGGAQLYEQLLPHCGRQILTWVECILQGDAFYPEFPLDAWRIVASQEGPTGEQYPYKIVTYERA